MKRITAIVRPEKMEVLKEALFAENVRGMTISQVNGCGNQHGWKEYYRGTEVLLNMVPKVKFEIVVEDHEVDDIVEVMLACARTGEVGHVKKLIEKKQGKGWEFIFMGANIDAAAEAANLGIAEGHAVTYRADSAGSKALYQSIACATSAVRACGVLTEDWADAVVADRRARG